MEIPYELQAHGWIQVLEWGAQVVDPGPSAYSCLAAFREDPGHVGLLYESAGSACGMVDKVGSITFVRVPTALF